MIPPPMKLMWKVRKKTKKSVRKPFQQHARPCICSGDESNIDKLHHAEAAPLILCYCIMDAFHLEETWENNKANSTDENTYLFKIFLFHICNIKNSWGVWAKPSEGPTLQTDKINVCLFTHILCEWFLHRRMVYHRLLWRPHTSNAAQNVQNKIVQEGILAIGARLWCNSSSQDMSFIRGKVLPIQIVLLP